MFYVCLMVTKKPKHIVSTQKIKRKEIKAYHYRKSSNYKGREKERKKGTTKQLENHEQNGNSKSIPINNYFKCIWTKFSNQKR